MKNSFIFLFIFVIRSGCCITTTAFGNLKELFWWKTLDYQFENEAIKQRSIESKEFVPENNIPFGVEVWRNKVFVTIPRRRSGIPSTLNYIKLDSSTKSPALIPYPDWRANNLSSRFLVSIYRVRADNKCNRLWTVDTGTAQDLTGRMERLFAPRIKIFNLLDDSLLGEYVLKPADYGCDTNYGNIVVDVDDSCAHAHAYLVDQATSSLLVYSLAKNESWRVQHPYFLPDPFQTDYQVNDVELQWRDGLLGFALGESQRKGCKNVYFHPMTSLHEFTTTTDVLENRTAVTAFKKVSPVVRVLGSRAKTHQAGVSAFDERYGILLYTLVNKNAVACWNAKKFRNEYRQDLTATVAEDDVAMIYFSDLKVDKDSNLWAISNKLPIILSGNISRQEVNFRIFSAPVRTLIQNTICKP